jgi:hypothetical protein
MLGVIGLFLAYDGVFVWPSAKLWPLQDCPCIAGLIAGGSCVCAAVRLQDAGDKQETDRNYENMWRQLRDMVGYGQQVPFINLVCNHTSFAQTVENIFTLSFLVSTHRAGLGTFLHAVKQPMA